MSLWCRVPRGARRPGVGGIVVRLRRGHGPQGVDLGRGDRRVLARRRPEGPEERVRRAPLGHPAGFARRRTIRVVLAHRRKATSNHSAQPVFRLDRRILGEADMAGGPGTPRPHNAHG